MKYRLCEGNGMCFYYLGEPYSHAQRLPLALQLCSCELIQLRLPAPYQAARCKQSTNGLL